MSGNSIKRNAVKWNTLSGLINAGQSAVIMIFISHFYSVEMAGIFTISYAMANLFMTMGKYGVRTFQVTDVTEEYSFKEYQNHRLATLLITVVLLIAYLIFQIQSGSYDRNKAMLVFLVCAWKLIDAFEDVFYGMYQQRGRLDIGAKCYSLRLIVSNIVLCTMLALKVDFLICMIVVNVVSIIAAFLFIRLSINKFKTSDCRSCSKVWNLFSICFSLFVGTTLSMFLGNSPKYLADWYMTSSQQAVCGYLMMPSFVILILSQFIYQPIIRNLADIWNEQKVDQFVGIIRRQAIVIFSLTVLIVIGGVVAGIPVLSILYNYDLTEYRFVFAILLAAGGMYAYVSFVMVPLTILRFQRCIAYCFLIAAIAVFLIGHPLISQFGMMGLSAVFLLQNVILASSLTAFLLYKIRQNH